MKKIFLAIGLLIAGLVNGQELTVIANKAGAPAQLKMAELQAIFMGKTAKWSNGNRIQLAMMKQNTDAGKQTCEKIFQMSTEEMKKYWLTQSMKGEDAPVFFNSAAELLEFLSKTPGAIGIVTGSPSPGTKIVLVDGKKTI